MNKSKFAKVTPQEIEIDRQFQRELDENRCKAMAKELDMNRIGVPVLSRRKNGSLVALDGQHRVYALQMAEHTAAILCEVHDGLTVTEEAELFLKLNGGRKAVHVHDKWKARIVANDPIALEIKGIMDSLGLRIARVIAPSSIAAVQSVESVHVRNGNLKATLAILKRWGDGVTPEVYDADLIKYVSHFLKDHPTASPATLIDKLSSIHPERVVNRIKRAHQLSQDIPRTVVASAQLRDIYNTKNRNKLPAPRAVETHPAVAGTATMQ